MIYSFLHLIKLKTKSYMESCEILSWMKLLCFLDSELVMEDIQRLMHEYAMGVLHLKPVILTWILTCKIYNFSHLNYQSSLVYHHRHCLNELSATEILKLKMISIKVYFFIFNPISKTSKSLSNNTLT